MADAGVSLQTPPEQRRHDLGEAEAEVLAPALPVDRLAALVRIAVEDDDSSRLVEAAARELGRPLGLVGLAGEPLAHSPDDSTGRRALAVARAVVRRAAVAPPPGWHVATVGTGELRRAMLAVGAGRAGAPGGALLDPIVALLGDQLLRAGLRHDKAEVFLRRLVSEPGARVQRARSEAAALGLALLDAYWPAVIAWSAGVPGPAALDGIAHAARRLVPGSLVVTVHARMVLLHPPGACRSDVLAWVERVVGLARTTVPSLDAHAVVADQEVALCDLRDHVTRLARLCVHDAARPVTRARQHALQDLLRESVPVVETRRFVDDLLGVLIAWDRDHRSDLVGVLEAALDHPRHDIAAQHCFMHRNTFRHRLQKARELMGDDLADPETRLALHVALKLRRAAASGRRERAAHRR